MLDAHRLRPAQPRRQGPDGHPRDLPARRAVPHAGRRARADGRGASCRPASAASCGSSSAATPTAATSRVPGLPAPRPLQHRRPRAVLRRSSRSSFGGESRRVHRPDERVDDRARALRGPPAAGAARSPTSTSPTSSAGSPTRPARGATTSPPPSIAEYGEDVGARLARTLRRRRSPRPTRRTSRAAHRRARPRPARGGSRRRRGIDLSLFSPLDAGRGEARLKVFRRRLAALAVAGAADAVVDGRRGRRRAALRARRPRPAVVHLRVRAALRAGHCPTRCASCSRTRIRAVWDGYNEIDGFNALVLGAGLTWRQATVLRAYAKYMRQGNTPVRAWTTSRTRCAATPTSPGCSSQLFEARFDPGRNGLGADAEARTARVEEIDDAHQARPRRRRQPRPRPDPALLPDPHPGDPAHQLLPADDDGRRPARLHVVQARAVGDPRPAASRGRASRSSSTRRGSRACTCASARSPAVACAGRTAATTSAPRCSAWSRRRWSRTP